MSFTMMASELQMKLYLGNPVFGAILQARINRTRASYRIKRLT